MTSKLLHFVKLLALLTILLIGAQSSSGTPQSGSSTSNFDANTFNSNSAYATDNADVDQANLNSYIGGNNNGPLTSIDQSSEQGQDSTGQGQDSTGQGQESTGQGQGSTGQGASNSDINTYTSNYNSAYATDNANVDQANLNSYIGGNNNAPLTSLDQSSGQTSSAQQQNQGSSGQGQGSTGQGASTSDRTTYRNNYNSAYATDNANVNQGSLNSNIGGDNNEPLTVIDHSSGQSGSSEQGQGSTGQGQGSTGQGQGSTGQGQGSTGQGTSNSDINTYTSNYNSAYATDNASVDQANLNSYIGGNNNAPLTSLDQSSGQTGGPQQMQ